MIVMTYKTTKTLKISLLLLTVTVVLTSTFVAKDSFAVQDNTTIADQKTKNLLAQEKLNQKMEARDLTDIPLVMSYLDGNGKVVVVVDKDGKETKAEYTKRIHDIVGNDADVSVNMGYFKREACSSLTADCDPLYGGIKVLGSQYGSLTIGATDTAGTHGFVTSGHIAGTVGTNIFQGGTTQSFKVGAVKTNPSLNNRYSDAAFVDHNTGNEALTNKIFKTSSTFYTVTATGTPVYQTHVQKTGYFSGETDGYVIGTNLTLYDPQYGVLRDQIAANYASSNGDSGAPVYSYSPSAGSVTLYGIHIGKGCLINQNPCPDQQVVTAFSKWSNVQSELSLSTIP